MDKIYITNILSTTDILISAGFNDGIEEGMILNIVDDDDDTNTIANPVTGEVLSVVHRFKFMLRVVKVYANFSRLTTVNDDDAIDDDFYDYDQPELSILDKDVIENIFDKYSHNSIKIGDKLVIDWC